MEFIFMMGLPASGKTTIATEKFAETHRFIDPDAIKEQHPDYCPERACDIHEWSMDQMERLFMSACLNGDGNWLLDGTGVNAEAMVRRMTIAKQWGYSVTLLYVTCTLETSLRRARARTRQVPESVIIEKSRNIATSFQLVSPFADRITVVDNDTDTEI
jgi:predicted kinase